MEAVHRADWVQADGTEFEVPVRLPDGSVVQLALRLVDVSPEVVDGGFVQYSLTFTGTDELPIGQGIAPLHHPVLGTREVFLVPVGSEGGLRRYHAAFAVRVGQPA